MAISDQGYGKVVLLADVARERAEKGESHACFAGVAGKTGMTLSFFVALVSGGGA